MTFALFDDELDQTENLLHRLPVAEGACLLAVPHGFGFLSNDPRNADVKAFELFILRIDVLFRAGSLDPDEPVECGLIERAPLKAAPVEIGTIIRRPIDDG